MRNKPSRLDPSAAALSAVLLAGCGGEAILVELSVDPAVSTEADLATTLRSLVWILDSPEGLYPPGAEATSGDVRVENVDADPALELVTEIALDGDRLPLVRIERADGGRQLAFLRVEERATVEAALDARRALRS